jgi:hypothetical protein
VTLAEVITTFRRWLFMPDARALLAVLGTVAANRLDGDPVWLLLVGPPGGGKSELLQSLSPLPDVHPTATLTEASLLSGTPKRDHDQTAKGGLLRVIGEFGIIVSKDFGSVLSMNREARAAVLAGLREVFDGAWTRHVGTDGGRTLHWAGKIGLIAGCTPTIDRHHAVIGSMGERFVIFRLPEVDGAEQARRALSHAGREGQMRKELGEAVKDLFAQGLAKPQPLSAEESDRLVSLATLVVRCRSAVERDGYTREIELIPEHEAPARLVVVLERLLAGLDVIGLSRDDSWDVMTKVGLDSVPALRRAILDVLFTATGELETSAIAEMVRYPSSTARRALEDLTAHGLVERHVNGQGKSDGWSLGVWARERLSEILGVPEKSEEVGEETVPEKSGSPITLPLPIEEDISGKVAGAAQGAAAG